MEYQNVTMPDRWSMFTRAGEATCKRQAKRVVDYLIIDQAAHTPTATGSADVARLVRKAMDRVEAAGHKEVFDTAVREVWADLADAISARYGWGPVDYEPLSR